MAKILLRLTDEIQQSTAIGRASKPSFSKKNFAEQCLPRLRDDDAAEIKIFIRVCLEDRNDVTINNFVVPILTQKDLIDWKNRVDIIQDVLETVRQHASKICDRQYGKLREALIQIIKENGLYPKVASQVYEVIYTGVQVYTGIDRREQSFIDFATGLIDTFPWRNHSQEAINLLNLITNVVQNKPSAYSRNICFWAVTEIGKEQGAQFQIDINEAMSKLFKVCMNSPWYWRDRDPSHTIEILDTIMNTYLAWNSSAKKLAPFIEDVKKIWYMNDELLCRNAEHVISNHCHHFELMGEKTTEKLIDLALTGENTKFLGNLSKMYPKHPQYFNKRFEEFIYAMKVVNSSDLNGILNILWNIAKIHPEEYSPKAISVIADMMLDSGDNVYMIFQIFNALAEHDPSEVFCHVDKLKQAIDNLGETGWSGVQIFLPLSRGDGDRAYVCLEYLTSKVDSYPTTYRPSLIHYMKSIGTEWPHLLAEYEGLLIKLSRAPALRDVCKSALDIIQGRSLEAVTNVVTEQQSNIEDLDSRLAITGDNLENIAKEMDARPKVTPRTSIKAKDEERGTESELLRQILQKLTVLDEMNETISRVDLRVKNIDKRLKSVEKQVYKD